MPNPFESQVSGIRNQFQDRDAQAAAAQRRSAAEAAARRSTGGGSFNRIIRRATDDYYKSDLMQSGLRTMDAKSQLRQGLLSSIEDMPGSYTDETNLLKQEANTALGEGVSNTRKNYNNRGMLYSGLRESGENSVKSNVASSLAKGMAGTTRDYQQTLDKRKQALASIGLQQQQQALEQASQAFEMTTRNNVARAQAMQQLGEGVGRAYGSYARRGSEPIPNTDEA